MLKPVEQIRVLLFCRNLGDYRPSADMKATKTQEQQSTTRLDRTAPVLLFMCSPLRRYQGGRDNGDRAEQNQRVVP